MHDACLHFCESFEHHMLGKLFQLVSKFGTILFSSILMELLLRLICAFMQRKSALLAPNLITYPCLSLLKNNFGRGEYQVVTSVRNVCSKHNRNKKKKAVDFRTNCYLKNFSY